MNHQMKQSHGQKSRRDQSSGIRAVCVALWVLFGGALGALAWNGLKGPTTLLLGSAEIQGVPLSLGLRIDLLSSLMLAMITLLGACIAQYSLRYLDGERRQGYFYRYLLAVVVSTCLLVASSNLLVFFAGWLGASFALHHLLTYYDQRPAAVIAARKKFIVSRIGDLAILGAIILTYQVFHSFEFQELFEKAAILEKSDAGPLIPVIGFLFALGAMTKSAQFPFHFWLPETMEAPAPVSALMHAGIINAGGFLVIRLSPILEHATAAHILLGAVGSATAVFGALVMITQNNIKTKLAYSTISQMGMMLFACGLGAYSLALFHIIAHSFYKAHAFLSTGTQVEESKRIPFNEDVPSPLFLSLMTALGLAVIFYGFYDRSGLNLPYYTYGTILFLGTIQNLGSTSFRKLGSFLFSQGSVVLSGLILVFVWIESFLNQQLSVLVPDIHTALNWSSPQFLLCIGAYCVFVVGFWLTAFLGRSQSPALRRLYCYFWNGGYFTPVTGVLLNQFFGQSKRVSELSSQILTTEHANA